MFDEILSQELVDEIETSLVEDLKRDPAVVCGVVGHVPSLWKVAHGAPPGASSPVERLGQSSSWTGIGPNPLKPAEA